MERILQPEPANLPEVKLQQPKMESTAIFLRQLALLLFSTKPAVLLNTDARLNRNGLPLNNFITNLLAPFSTHQFICGDKRRLILIYRPDRFIQILSQTENAFFLKGFGYRPDLGLSSALAHWQTRLRNGFPHETGIFLGIPLPDVRSFIRFDGKHYLFNRYWKVYHHPDWAKRIFHEYDLAKIKIQPMIDLCWTQYSERKGFPSGKPC